MGKEKNEEQEFLRNVECFLNGEETVPGEDAGEDIRSTIEFARKLTELRADPSPEFQESLKSKLLRKLTEQEMAARERAGSGWFGGFWNRLIPQSPVWRTAAVTVTVVVVAAGVMWQTGLFTIGDAEVTGETDRGLEVMSSDDSQKDWNQDGMVAAGEEEEEEEEITLTIPPGIENGDSILGEELAIDIEISSTDEITIIIEPLVTQYGTEITLTLTFRNTGSETVTIDPIQPEIVVKSHDDELVYILPAVDGPAELSPSESFQMLYVWEQQDNSGAQVPAGTYKFNIGSIIITFGTSSGEITPPPAEVVIQEP